MIIYPNDARLENKMINLLMKKPNKKKILFFCEWFIENNRIIIDSFEKIPQDTDQIQYALYEIQACLAVPYRDGYKGNIELEIGYNESENKYELRLFHLNNRYLIKVSLMIRDYLHEKIGGIWNIFTLE